jgi:hypothetical protein
VTHEERERVWTVVKIRPDGSIATRYHATEIPAPDGWIAVEARWKHGHIDIGCFAFEQGDVLLEYFSLDNHYNAFATFRESGEFVAWYCNVTHPTFTSDSEIFWHDLFVDVVALPSGDVLVLDEDELEESGLEHREPDLHARIVSARDELLAMLSTNAYPFSEVDRSSAVAEPRTNSDDSREQKG